MKSVPVTPSGQRLHGENSPPLRAWMLGLAGLVGFGPLIIQFFLNQWKQEAHQFFPLAIAGAVLLAWRGCCEVRAPLEPGSGRIAMPLMLASLAILFIAALSWSPWLGVAALLLWLCATAWSLGGWGLARVLAPAGLVLVTILPIPLKLDERLALTLEQWAVTGSSRALSLLGVDHILSGNVIEIPGYRLLVEEACSGIVSVIFMTSACVFYAMWRRRSLPALLVLWAVTIGCVLAGNILRITSCTWLLVNHRINLFEGWRHETLGIVFMLAYLLCIVLAEAAIPRRAALSAGTGGRSWREIEGLLLGEPTFRGGARLLAVALALLGLLQILVAAQRHYAGTARSHVNPREMDGSAKFSLPENIGGWHLRSPATPVSIRTPFEDGVYSHIWEYERGGLSASLALDYPFFNYHDVRVCYRMNGWAIAKSTLHSEDIPCMEVSLTGKGGRTGIVFFSTVNESGGWLDESNHLFYEGEGASEGAGGVGPRLFCRMVAIPFFQQLGEVGVTYRVQLLASSRDGFSERERKQLQEFFEQSRSLLVKQFVKAPSAP